MLDALLPRVHALQANFITVPGVRAPFVAIMERIVAFLAVTSISICTVLFTVGAFYLVFSRGDETHIKTGKDLMIGSLVGLAVVLGSYGILRTIFYYLYAI